MYHYYAIFAFWLLFGAPTYYWRSNTKRAYGQLQQISESDSNSNSDLAQESYSSSVPALGDICTLFERKAQELCSYSTKNDKIELSILMANCHLETLNAPPLSFDTVEGMQYASEAEKIIALQMLTRLPVFCSSLATLSMRLGFMTQSNTYSMMNETNIKLEEITRIANGFEKDNKKGIEVQKELIDISTETLKQSLELISLAEKINTSFGNFSNGIEQILTLMQGFKNTMKVMESDEKQTAFLLKQYSSKADNIWNETQNMMRVGQDHVYGSQERTLSMELVKHQIFLLLLCVLFIVSRTNLAAYSIITFFVVTALFLLIVVIYFTRLSSYSSAFSLIKIIFGIFSGKIISNINMGLLGFFLQIMLLVFVVYQRFERTVRRFGQPDISENSRIPVPGFDIHNTNEVVAFLKLQERDLDAVLRRVRLAIDFGSTQNKSRFGRVILRSPEPLLKKKIGEKEIENVSREKNEKFSDNIEPVILRKSKKPKTKSADKSKPVKSIMKNEQVIEAKNRGKRATRSSKNK